MFLCHDKICTSGESRAHVYSGMTSTTEVHQTTYKGNAKDCSFDHQRTERDEDNGLFLAFLCIPSNAIEFEDLVQYKTTNVPYKEVRATLRYGIVL